MPGMWGATTPTSSPFASPPTVSSSSPRCASALPRTYGAADGRLSRLIHRLPPPQQLQLTDDGQHAPAVWRLARSTPPNDRVSLQFHAQDRRLPNQSAPLIAAKHHRRASSVAHVACVSPPWRAPSRSQRRSGQHRSLYCQARLRAEAVGSLRAAVARAVNRQSLGKEWVQFWVQSPTATQ